MFRATLNKSLAKASHIAPTVQRRGVITLAEKKYTATATAQGLGRNGRVVSQGGADFDLKLATPKELGGNGDGSNPEQLFAMGYASCFLGALQLIASRTGAREAAQNAKIHTDVHIGPSSGVEGFALCVDIKVEGVEDEKLIQTAHEFCPYSRALTKGVVVNVSKA